MTVTGYLAILPKGVARKQPLPFAPLIRDWNRGDLW
jgi:hypothetical protein